MPKHRFVAYGSFDLMFPLTCTAGDHNMTASPRRLVIMLAAVVLCLLALVWFGVFSPQPASETQPVVLRIGLEDHYPPMAFTDDQGRHTGFDHDFSVALCHQMQVECELVIGRFENILQKMADGELELVVAGLAAQEDRKHYMEFTDAYYRSRTIYIGRPNLSLSPAVVRGKKIAAQTSTAQLAYLNATWRDVADILEGSHEEVLAMLCDEKVDLMLVDGLIGYNFLKSEQGKGFDIIGDPLEINDVMSLARIGVRKGRPDLVDAVNKALVSLRVSGEYDRISRKYFSFSIY